jgi:hypothetical protein
MGQVTVLLEDQQNACFELNTSAFTPHVAVVACGVTRGHLGGLLGGAAVSWALGPHLVRDEVTGEVVDRPPLAIMASSSTSLSSSSKGSRRKRGKPDTAEP